MRIESAAVQRTIPLTSVVSGSLGSERVSLPVSRSQALYARFKHVSGCPDPAGGGHPLARLRSLDNLIDRLIRMKEMKPAEAPPRGQLTGMSEESLDAMIQDLSAALHRASLKSGANPFLDAGSLSGLLTDFSL